MRRRENKHQGAILSKLIGIACAITLLIVLCLPSSTGSNNDIDSLITDTNNHRALLSLSTPGESERKAADKIIENGKVLPRHIFFTNDFKLASYPASFCGGENFDNCDTKHYIESIFLTSGIGFVVAVVSLILGVLFWAFRCCCFGGCHASTGACIPGERFDEEVGLGYSNKEVLIVKVLVGLVLLCLVPFFVVGHVGNASFTTATTSFTSTVLDAAGSVVDSLQYIDSALKGMPMPPEASDNEYQEQIKEAISQALNASKTVLQRGTVMADEAKYYNAIREKVILAGLILPVVMLALTLVAALFNLGPLSLVTAILGFIVLAYGWISFSVHYPLSLVSTDVCVTFNDGGLSSILSTTPRPGNNVTYQLNSTTDNLVLNALVECGLEDGKHNPFEPLLVIAQNGLTFAYDLACGGFDQLCNATYPCPRNNDYTDMTTCRLVDCPTNLACNETTIAEYRKSNVTDFEFGCIVANVPVCPYNQPIGNCPKDNVIVCNPTAVPFEQCPDNCRVPEARNATRTIIVGLDLLASFTDILVNHIFPLLNCKFISDLLGGMEDALCVSMVNALTYISTGEAGLSCLMIAGVTLSILGIKRFNPKNKLEKEDDSEVGQY